MPILFWKKNRLIDVFATDVANELYSFVQPQSVQDYFTSASKGKKDKKKIESFLNGIIKQMRQFRLTHALGVYGKARLQLKFNERLSELGYDKDVIARLNQLILVRAEN